MSTIKLGELINTNQYRDAIHIAVAPVFSDHDLKPGDHISLVVGSNNQVKKSDLLNEPIGIADPFLPANKPILAGQQFWMLLYQQTITSLRHEWTHPAFVDNKEDKEDKKDNVKKAEQWIMNYSLSINVDYDELMEAADKYLKDGKFFVGGRNLESVYTDDNFWIYYEIATGKVVPVNKRNNFFSCAC